MKTFGIVLLVIVGAILFLGLIFATSVLGMYNSMVQDRLTVDKTWADVESDYQRRYDLIPGLVNATKGVLKQEQKVFGDIAEARTHYAGAQSTEDKVAATNQLDSALARLMVIVENYPVLQSNQTVRDLMDELSGTENRIKVSRTRYNDQVLVYNTSIATFPRSFIAGMFGFQPKPFYKSDEAASQAVPVDLNVN